jgi:hypothetical protein
LVNRCIARKMMRKSPASAVITFLLMDANVKVELLILMVD